MVRTKPWSATGLSRNGKENMDIAENCVVSINFRLTNDQGEVLDQSEEGTPLVYLHGAVGIIPALENELTGKSPGDSFSVTVTPEEGYGERQDQMVQQVPRTAFPEPDKLETGMQFQATAADGQTNLTVTLIEVGEDTVTVDANHPLAGMTLLFEGTVEDVRPATEEEIAQGHPSA